MTPLLPDVILKYLLGDPPYHTYNYLWEIWLTCTITNLTHIHGRMSISPISLWRIPLIWNTSENVGTFDPDVSRRYWKRQEKRDPRDCDNYKYVRRRETVESRQQKRNPRNSMEAMLPQSLGSSDSDRMGFGVCERRNPQSQSLSWWIPRRWMQALGLPPPRGGRPLACIHILGIHYYKLWLLGFILSQTP